MKQDWLLRLELHRFYDKNKELRARVSKGVLKDEILFAVFANSLEKEFTKIEINQAVKLGFILKERINVNGTMRIIYCWTEEKCIYQPIWYKRWFQSALKYCGY